MTGIKSNTDLIKKATKIVEENLANELFGVSELANELGISRSYLHRKINAHEKLSVSQFIRRIRLKKAKELLQNTSLTVSAVAFDVGYSSVTYFSKCYHDYYGYAPGVERKRIVSETPVKIQTLHRRNVIVPVFVAAVVLFFSVYFIFKPGTKKQQRTRSFAVLPPTLNNSDSTYYFEGQGIAGMLIENLSKINEIDKVVPWITTQPFADSNLSDARLSKELGANYIVRLNIGEENNEIYVDVELYDSEVESKIWFDQYNMSNDNLIQLPKEIAKDIAEEVDAELSNEDKMELEKVYTRIYEAYDLYTKGRVFWNKRTENGVRNSIELFKMSIRKDSTFALAWAGMADAWCILSGYGWHLPKKGGEDLAKAYAQKALELDNSLAEAHTALGFLYCYSDWKWEESEKELQEAIRLKPDYSFSHLVYALLLDIKGNSSKARDEINIALELDPFAPVLHYVSATLYYNQGDYNNSLKECEKILSLEKNFASIHWWLFKNYYKKGQGKEAADVLISILKLNAFTEIYANEVEIAFEGAGLEGLIELIIEITNKVKNSNPDPKIRLYWESYLPEIYAISGREDDALALLEDYLKSNSEGDRLVRLLNNPDYIPLRNNKRFRNIINKLGLNDYYNSGV